MFITKACGKTLLATNSSVTCYCATPKHMPSKIKHGEQLPKQGCSPELRNQIT